MSRIYLRALKEDDYLTTHTWRINERFSDQVSGLKRFVSIETEKEWVKNAIAEHAAGKKLRFIICHIDTHEIVGMMSIDEIDLINRTCFASGAMIDEKFQGQGYVKEARIKVFDYLFDHLNMQKVKGAALASNEHSVKAIEKFGYVQEGRLRRAIYKNGQYHDHLLFGILKEEYFALYRAK